MQHDEAQGPWEAVVHAAPRFRLGRSAAWMATAVVSGAVVTWIVSSMERYFAPIVLFPLISGLILGGILWLAMRQLEIAHRPSLAVGTLVAAAVLVAGVHYASFRQARRSWDALTKENPAAAMLGDANLIVPVDASTNFAGFLKQSAQRGRNVFGWRVHGAWAWTLWAIEAALIAGAAQVVVGLGWRMPYCDRCGSWHRMVRATDIDAETALAVAGICQLASPGTPARCRLWSCRGACEPSGCELLWNSKEPDARSMAWLGRSRQNRVVAVLDERQ